MTSLKAARAARINQRVSRIRDRHATAAQAAVSPPERMDEAVRYLRSAVATVNAASPSVLGAAVRLVNRCADELLDLAAGNPR